MTAAELGFLSYILIMPKRGIRLATEDVDRVNRALQKLFRQAGRGTIKKVEIALGVHIDYFRTQRVERRMDLGVLLSALEKLEVDPGEFFADLFPAGDPSGSARATPATGKAAMSDAEMTARKPSASRSEAVAWLEEMDELRYDDPEGTLTQLRDRARDDGIHEELVSHYLCVAGSTHRALGSLADANICLDGAERRLWPGDESRRANILQRRSYVVADGGKFAKAVSLSVDAFGIFSALRDSLAQGKVLVDRAMFLAHLERFDDAERAARMAISLLPESEVRNHFSAQQYLSHIQLKRGNYELAAKHIASARRFASHSTQEAHALWSESRLRIACGHRSEALSLLQQVIPMLLPLSPLDALLATAENIRLLIKMGRLPEALSVAQTVQSFVGHLRGNGLAEAAIGDIYRHCTGEAMSAATITSIIKSLRRSQVQPKATFSSRISEACAYLGVPVSHLTEKAGVPRGVVARVELGEQVAGPYRKRLEGWLVGCLPELQIAMA